MSFSSSFDPNNNPSWGFVLIVKRSISPTVKKRLGFYWNMENCWQNVGGIMWFQMISAH
jgi:hypothetical protein